MIDTLEEFGYIYDHQSKIWMTPDFSGIAYNDGDEIENRIATIVNSSRDVSVFSEELHAKITDWPSTYHLSFKRSNLLRPFKERLSHADVLEIGAGCGAITRFLGESGANVLALEGSPRRAAIARSRTRDLDNVTVLSDAFENFKSDKKFDVITLIGVLEYAIYILMQKIRIQKCFAEWQNFLNLKVS